MNRLGRALPVAILIVLPFLFHWRLFAVDPAERRIFRGDFLNQHYVWKSYALSRVSEGELPLWNPHALGGVAFHANPQAAVFYPPTYLLLPFQDDGRVSYVALEAYQLWHQVFAGLGMWLLMRAFGISNLGALFAAVVFTFTGFFTTPGHHAILVTASWFPWVLLAARRLEGGATKRSVALLALALAAMTLAGHPQIAYYGTLLSGAFVLARCGVRSTLVGFGPAATLAIGISAIQLLPTYRLAEESSRSGLGYEYATSFSFSPYFLGAAVVPRGQVRLPGQAGAAPLHLYAGIGTLLLAGVGLTLGPRGFRVFFAGAALIALLLSFGRASPLFDWFYAAVPGFERFRVPYRLLGVYTLGMSVLAGVGFQVLEDAGRKTRVRLRSFVKVAVAALLLLGAWAGYLHTRIAASGSLEPAAMEQLVGGAYWAVLLGTLNIVLVEVLLWRPKERWVLPTILAITVIDLGAFVKDRGERPYDTLARAGERFVHRVVRAQSDRTRYVSGSNLENYATLHGIDFAGGHAALIDARYAELLDTSRESANVMSLLNVKFIDRGGAPSSYPWCGSRFAAPLPILDITPELAPARLEIVPPVVASSFRVDWEPLGAPADVVLEVRGETHRLEPGEPLEVRFDEPTTVDRLQVSLGAGNAGVRIAAIEVDLNPIGLRSDFLVLENLKINLHALPRAYFMVPSRVPSEVQTLESLACWSVHEGVQVQHSETGAGASGFFRKNVTTVTRYEPERVEIETRSPREGFVVLADTYRPGWIAEVDGTTQPILRAQWSMRAVEVPAGEHQVVFRYAPRSLRSGARVSAISLSLVLALLFVPRIWSIPSLPIRRVDQEMAPPDDDFA